MTPETVAVVGAFPPPLHGFALVSQRLAEGAGSLRLATSPRRQSGAGYVVEKLARAAAVVGQMLRRSRGVVVIGLDGDHGLWLNLVEALAAAARGHHLFLYHHSARCLARPTWEMRLLTARPLAAATHVMCSEAMIARFCDLYGWRGRTFVVGNLAYVELAAGARARRWPSGRLTLGFLSNLMRSKGVLAAVDTLRLLVKRGVDARLIMAGPLVENELEPLLRRAEIELEGRLELLGWVDADAKAAFLRETDVFLFPTTHPHETQSLVVPEALSAGIPVIAHAHGYVSEVLPAGWPGLIETGTDFAESAASLVERWRADAANYEDLSARALSRFHALKAVSDDQFACLITALRTGRP